MPPKVSVVVGVYNLEDIVLETIHSILGQSYRDLELIVVDDGSTDTSADLIEAVQDPRLKLIRAPHTGLPAAAISHALEHSRGELIGVTGADDVWLPDRVARQVEFFDRHPTVGVIHTGFHYLIDGQVKLRPMNTGEPEIASAEVVLPRMLEHNFICTPSVIVRREVIDRAGGLFDPDPLLCGPEDFDLWLRLCEEGVCFGYIPEPLVKYRIRGNSVSRNQMKDWRGTLHAVEKALARKPELYAQHDRIIRQRVSRLYRNMGRHKLLSGQPGGLADFRRAVNMSPASLKDWGWLLLGICGTRIARGVVGTRDAFTVSANR